MSHTTKFTSSINDVETLQRAVQMLQHPTMGSIQCSLEANATPRMYYQNQIKRDTGRATCDYVLKLPNCQYDIGLNWNPTKRAFDLIYDTWGGHLRRQVGISMEEYNKEIAQMRARHDALNRATGQSTVFVEPHADSAVYCKLLKAYGLATVQFGLQNAPHLQLEDMKQSTASNSHVLTLNAML